MSSKKLLCFLVLLVFITNPVNCCQKEVNITIRQCDELPSCGLIHNISYPFRLKGQHKDCGEPKYELECENNTTLTVNISMVKYFVRSINPNNFTILVAESVVQRDNCSSIPRHQIITTARYEPSDRYDSSSNHKIIFLSCENPLTNRSVFVDTRPCVNGSLYSYVTSVEDVKLSDLGALCSVDSMALTAKPIECGFNCSYSEIHDLISYGFELSWRVISCQKYCKGYPFCDLENRGNVIAHCADDRCDYRYAGRFSWVSIRTLIVLFYLITSCIVSLLALRCFIGLLVFYGFLIYKWHRRHQSKYDSIEEFLQTQNNLRPIKYSFSDIKKMTKGFKDKLGEGGFGSVYKGRLRSGRDVAIKVLMGKPKANGQDFINEVATIGRIHHVNVVRLIGFCAERSNRALVYEFMPNGSLEKHIFPREGNSLLGCEKTFEISLGVARGIEYLHRGCDMHILHFDIKPHNILLDENFTPKVSDFGLAKLYPIDGTIATLTAVRGTIGYIAPELLYRNIGNVSHKADVYSFGMLLLEMTGKRRVLNANAENSSQIYFPNWIYDQISEARSLELEEDETKLVKKMVIVGLWCIQMRPNDRPPMNRVIEMLESEIECLEMPPKPSLNVAEEEEIKPTSSSLLSGDSTESSSLILNVN